uniref:Uncharacterized protein n=1 Tax=Acrobeloides nanus TaxID=290746 RepID=A0A914CPI8_9BILA
MDTRANAIDEISSGGSREIQSVRYEERKDVWEIASADCCNCDLQPNNSSRTIFMLISVLYDTRKWY